MEVFVLFTSQEKYCDFVNDRYSKCRCQKHKCCMST